jgi:hypothetical protein
LFADLSPLADGAWSPALWQVGTGADREYDANGNLTYRPEGTLTLAWDRQNRLATVSESPSASLWKGSYPPPRRAARHPARTVPACQ